MMTLLFFAVYFSVPSAICGVYLYYFATPKDFEDLGDVMPLPVLTFVFWPVGFTVYGIYRFVCMTHERAKRRDEWEREERRRRW
jgi:hypothetical protein